MGMFDRVKQMFTGKANDALDSLEDETSLGNQIIRDLDEKIGDAEDAFNRVQGQLMLASDDLEHVQSQIKIWSDAVLKADQKGDSCLTAECIEKLQEFESAKSELQTQYDDIKASSDLLQTQIDQLLKERNKSAHTVRVMSTTAKVAEAQSAVADAIADASSTSHTSNLARLQRKVAEESATARAKIASQKRSTGGDLLDRVKESQKESASDVVARLRGQSQG